MEDESFLYFAKDEVIDKINIDPRLVDSFKRVMKKIQEYFNANGYTAQRDYFEYLKKYLLESGKNNMFFYVEKLPNEKIGGFYNKADHKICINTSTLDIGDDALDATLCHEFIHFLVMHGLTMEKGDPEIYEGGFINEALTEMLTQQMYPNSNSYDAQVAMHKFANLLSGQVNNYGKFLQGGIDARKFSSSEWIGYSSSTSYFQEDFNNAGYINLRAAQNNQNYIEAQRNLIELFISSEHIKTFDEYCEKIKMLNQRPAKDQDYINEVFERMDRSLLMSLGYNIGDAKIMDFLKQELSKVRDTIREQNEYKVFGVFEFELGGRIIKLDKHFNLLGETGYGVTRWPIQPDRTIRFSLGDEEVVFNADEIDFSGDSKRLNGQIKELSPLFTKEASNNLKSIVNIVEKVDNISKIEKFTIPVIGLNGKKIGQTIYVATIGDKVYALNNCRLIGNVSNLKQFEYIGSTSKDPNDGELFMEEIGTIDNGVMFSTMSDRLIINSSVNKIIEELEESLSEEEIAAIVKDYKDKNFIEGLKEADIKYFALEEIAKNKYNSLDEEARESLENRIISENDRFIISVKDGVVSVSLAYKDIAFACKGQVLYDTKGKGLYNGIFDGLKKTVVSNKDLNEEKKQVSNKFSQNVNKPLVKEVQAPIIIQDENMEEGKVISI